MPTMSDCPKTMMAAVQDAVYGEGLDDDIKPKLPASRKRKSAEEEESIKSEADAIDFKVILAVLLLLTAQSFVHNRFQIQRELMISGYLGISGCDHRHKAIVQVLAS